MINVWASGGRIGIKRDGDTYAGRVPVDALPFALYLMGVMDEPSLVRRFDATVAHGARCRAGSRRAHVQAGPERVHGGRYAGPPRAR